MDEDLQHLNLLGTFHYILGGIGLLLSLLPLLHVTMGALAVFGGVPDAQQEVAAFVTVFGVMFMLFGALAVVLGLTLSACMIAAGGNLKRQRRYTFCLVVGGCECIAVPLGTVLGVFTVIVLSKDSVKRLFRANDAPEPPRVD